jgi:hypothetical protein
MELLPTLSSKAQEILIVQAQAMRERGGAVGWRSEKAPLAGSADGWAAEYSATLHYAEKAECAGSWIGLRSWRQAPVGLFRFSWLRRVVALLAGSSREQVLAGAMGIHP